MKRLLVLAALLMPMAFTGCSHPQQAPYYPPPPAFSQIAQRGFHDGIQAARRDLAAGRPPDAARHPRFRRPPVPPPAFEDYRHGFRQGYQSVFRQGPPPGF